MELDATTSVCCKQCHGMPFRLTIVDLPVNRLWLQRFASVSTEEGRFQGCQRSWRFILPVPLVMSSFIYLERQSDKQ